MVAADTIGRYAIGQQDFKTLRLDNAIYVDKSRYMELLVKSPAKFYFLARPRRFGKSLFLSMLKYFFEGERYLFKGLYIDTIDWDWEPRPVFHIDLNGGEYNDLKNLDIVIDNLLRGWERKYEVTITADNITTRFQNVIEKAHESTGKQVIILVDEYDKPLIKNLDSDRFEEYREKLAALYSNFKTSAQHIQLLFMTGVSRFSKLTVFSGLNNLKDITFSNEFADICGITEKELYSYFKEGIKMIAERYQISFDEMKAKLKKNYDGYRFAEEGSDIYNPWSVLNCFDDKKIAFYWNETGFPSIIVKALRKMHSDLEETFNTECDEEELKGFDLTDPNPVALMYQTGYLTIKDYDPMTGTIRLGIPNEEVKSGLFKILIPYYAKFQSEGDSYKVKEFLKWIRQGKPERFMESMQTYFAGVSYMLKMDNENNFHNAFFLVTNLIGINSDAEVVTSDGRIDMTIKTPRFIYIIELKYDRSAREALDQINRKEYARMFRDDSRKLFKIGVNFSSETRTINDWLIE